MDICIIGTGYVGLTAGACFANAGHRVVCVDNNLEKISSLNKGIIPIFEPNLDELVRINLKKGRLFFSDDIKLAVQKSKVCFIAVGTPAKDDLCCDLKNVFDVAEKIGNSINEYKVIVNKSTAPVGTVEKIREIIKEKTDIEFDVISNPEFLKQGEAVDDFINPNRVIIGADSKRAVKIMQELYGAVLKPEVKMIIEDIRSAELTKYVANSFLATKISFMNEVANLCEKVGANINDVRYGMALDDRIGDKFLFSGVGFGGSCFPKDLKTLINMGNKFGCEMKIATSAENVNKNQKKIFVDKILKRFENNIEERTFALWGLSFKPNTNDIREAPSIEIIDVLLKKGAKIKVYDPKAMNNMKLIFKDNILYSENKYEILKEADTLILLTEWNDFKNPDFFKIKSLLKYPVIFDGRNLYNKKDLISLGFDYIAFGV